MFTEIIKRMTQISWDSAAGLIFKNIQLILLLITTLLLWCFLDKIVDGILKRCFHIAEERTKQTLHDMDSIRRNNMLYRMATLRQLTTQLARSLLGITMCVTLLSTVGINLRPVFAGIGIVGLGVSLAAQSIIKDFINGVLILVEDQYNVNDWVGIGGLDGTVEQFTLRVTRLRGIDGSLITIPNSTIQTVVNYTKDWSKAAVYVTIPYEEDYAQAREIMIQLAEETVNGGDRRILREYSFSGITDYAPDGVKFRCLIKTAPGQQWAVGYKFREELRARYNSAGIKFAYPAASNYFASQTPRWTAGAEETGRETAQKN